jgi:hypothetical protein
LGRLVGAWQFRVENNEGISVIFCNFFL